MDLNIPDLTGLSLRAIVSLTILLGLIDTGYAVLQAIVQKVLSLEYLIDFLGSHGVKVWFPITALAVLGGGVQGLDIPPIGIATDASVVALVAYALGTIKSLAENTRNSSAPS